MALLQANQIELNVKDDNAAKYNPYKKPADLSLAEKHGKAKKVYMKHSDKIYKLEGRAEVCVCCGLPVEGQEEIPLIASLDKLYHLGAGFALYFKFIKYSIGILMLLFLISGIYNLASNVYAKDCEPFVDAEQIYCLQGYITTYTISNKREHPKLLTAQVALNLGCVVAMILFFHYLRYQFRKTQIEAEDKTLTPADYTVSIDGIPPKATKDEIIQYFEGFGTTANQIKIIDVIKPYIISDYIELTNKVSELKQQQDEMKKENESLTPADELRYNRLGKELERTEKKLSVLKNQKPEFSSIAYVIFEKAEHAIFIQDRFKLTWWQHFLALLLSLVGCCLPCTINTKYQFQGKNVVVKRAPEPTDIMWENLGSKKSWISRQITIFVTLVLIALTFGLTFLINRGQAKVAVSLGDKSFAVQAFSILGSIVIVISNTILTLTVDHLTRFEKHYTYTNFLQGVANKLALAQIFNSAFSTLFVELILADSEEGKSRLQSVNFYGSGGLLENIYWVFITNSLLTPILTVFDFGYFYKYYRRITTKKKNTIMQKDAHILYEGSNMIIPAKYATILKTMLLCCFYAPFMPFSLVYAIAGLILFYWADKYILLRRHALPKSVNDSLAKDMVEFLEWATFAFSMGSMVCVLSLKDSEGDFAFGTENDSLIWITFGISLFHIFFPMESLNKKLFPIIDKLTETITYEDAQVNFTTDYYLENPSTRKEALEKLIKRVKGGEGQLDFFKNLRNSDLEKRPVGATEIFGVRESEGNDHPYQFWDNYAAKLQKKATYANTSPGPSTKDPKDLLSHYISEYVLAAQGDSPLNYQPNQEVGSPEQGKFLKEMETKGSLIPWLQQAQPSQTPSHQYETSDQKLVDLGALNFIAPHYQEVQGKKSKHGPESSGNIDPDDCVEESEPTAREFVVQRSLRDKGGVGKNL